VDWWCRNRSVAHLLITLASGEIVWDQSTGDFDWERTTALPQRLRGTFAHEPRWIDFRWARTETDVSLRHPVFRQGVADLAAPLHGRPKDEIIGDDVLQQRRAQALRAVAVSALLVFAIAVAVTAWIALEQRNAALIEESRALAMTSREEMRDGRTRQAIASALKALPARLSAPDRPHVPIAEVALASALRAHRELSVLSGHESDVASAVFSPDGSRILTSSDDRTARLWDAATGQVLHVVEGHEDTVWTAAFSPDGDRVVTASRDRKARTWDAIAGEETAVFQGHGGAVYTAAISPDGDTLVMGSEDRMARLWSLARGEELLVLQGHDGPLRSASFSPDGSVVLTASADGSTRLWDAVTGETLVIMRGHEHWIYLPMPRKKTNLNKKLAPCASVSM
jgi:hypothetical protein